MDSFSYGGEVCFFWCSSKIFRLMLFIALQPWQFMHQINGRKWCLYVKWLYFTIYYWHMQRDWKKKILILYSYDKHILRRISARGLFLFSANFVGVYIRHSIYWRTLNINEFYVMHITRYSPFTNMLIGWLYETVRSYSRNYHLDSMYNWFFICYHAHVADSLHNILVVVYCIFYGCLRESYISGYKDYSRYTW